MRNPKKEKEIQNFDQKSLFRAIFGALQDFLIPYRGKLEFNVQTDRNINLDGFHHVARPSLNWEPRKSIGMSYSINEFQPN